MADPPLPSVPLQEQLKQQRIAEREAKEKQKEVEREAKEKERKKRAKENEKRRAREEALRKEEQERLRKVRQPLPVLPGLAPSVCSLSEPEAPLRSGTAGEQLHAPEPKAASCKLAPSMLNSLP